MKPGTLAALSIAALAVVGYAAWTLMADPGEPRGARSGTADDPLDADGERMTPPRPKGGIKVVTPTRLGDARPKPGPPPRPEPKVSLEKARADFAALLTEYDTLIEDESVLDDPRWVELYAKGADLLTPLQQHLSWDVPAQAEELRQAQDAYRERIEQLQSQVPRAPL